MDIKTDAQTPSTSGPTENPAAQVKLTDYFALEATELADFETNPEVKKKVEAIVAYQRERRRVFFEEQKGKARVKKEKSINDILDKKA